MTSPSVTTSPAPEPSAPLASRLRWLLGAGVGAWATLCGFAAFVLIQGKLELSGPPVEGRGASSPVFEFVLGIAAAALVSFVAESLHERIKEGPRAATVTFPRVLVLMLLLAVFEVFASAGHEMVDHLVKTPLATIAADVRTAVAPATPAATAVSPARPPRPVDPFAEVVLLVGLWASVSAVLGLRLMGLVRDLPANFRSVGRGALEGLLAGFLVAPLIVVGVFLAVRLGVHVTTDPKDGGAGILATLVLMAGLAVAGWAWGRSHRRLAAVILVAVIAYVVRALDQDLARLGTVAVLAALVWGVPATVLGALAPLLRTRAEEPRLWGGLAAGTALLLMLLTVWRLKNPVFYAVAVGIALIAAVFFFWRGSPARLRFYWPLLAIAMAAMVSTLTFVVQYATFMGVLAQFHALNAVPVFRPSPIDRLQAALGEFAQGPDYENKKIQELVRRARDFSRMPRDRQLVQLPVIQATIKEVDQSLRDETAAYYKSGRMKGVITRDEVEDLYGALAAAVNAKVGPERVGRLELLLAKATELLETERARLARAPVSPLRERARAAGVVLPDPLEPFEHLRSDVEREVRVARGEAAPVAPVKVDRRDIGIRVVIPMAAPLTDLGAARAQLAKVSAEAEALQLWLTGPTARALELTLVGSFGFWMTVGLLAAWNMAFPLADAAEE